MHPSFRYLQSSDARIATYPAAALTVAQWLGLLDSAVPQTLIGSLAVPLYSFLALLAAFGALRAIGWYDGPEDEREYAIL